MTRPLKIGFVLPAYWPLIGGCELLTRELVKRLSPRHEVRVVTLVNGLEEKQRGGEFWFGCALSAPAVPEVYRDNGASVTKLGLKAWEKYAVFPFIRIQSPRVPRVLRRAAMRIATHFYKRKLMPLLDGCDVVNGVHGDVSWLSYAAMLAARRKGIPFVYTPVSHLYSRERAFSVSYRDGEGLSLSDLPMTPRGSLNETWLDTCREADAVFAMTEYERNFFIRNGVNINVFTTGMGPLVVENPPGGFKKKYGAEGKRAVLYLGRVNPEKGVKEILGAAQIVWNRFPDTCFFFVGPMEWGMERVFSEIRDPRIVYTGAVSVEEKSSALKECDLLCVPSVVESLGGVLLEAWSFGKPVIGCDIPPTREVTGGGNGGVLVEPSPSGVAKGIISLLENPQNAAGMGEWGRKRVAELYSWDRIFAKVENVFYGLAELRGNAG